MPRSCVKCGHVNLKPTNEPNEACPECGVIYAKAQPTAARPVTAATRASPSSGYAASRYAATNSALARQDEWRAEWVDTMRRESLYGAFRNFARVLYRLTIGAIVVLALFSVAAAFKLGWFWAVPIICTAVIAALAAKAVFEGTIMLADMSDATVRAAAITAAQAAKAD